MSTEVVQQSQARDAPRCVLSIPLPKDTLVARTPHLHPYHGSIDHLPHGSQFIPWDIPHITPLPEFPMLTVFSHPFSAQLQTAASKIQVALRTLSQIYYQAQSPDFTSEIGKSYNRITAIVTFSPALCCSRSFK